MIHQEPLRIIVGASLETVIGICLVAGICIGCCIALIVAYRAGKAFKRMWDRKEKPQ